MLERLERLERQRFEEPRIECQALGERQRAGMCGPQRSAPREEALAAAGSGHMIQVTLSGQTWQRSDVEQANPAVESIVCQEPDCQMSEWVLEVPASSGNRIGTALGKEMGGRKQMSGELTAHWARTGYVTLRPLGVETFIPNKQ